eukprot:scaffold45823_cov281-Isochrysis_galbana.AAC.1
MAPRQLRLEPIEVDTGADKGPKPVRVDSTDESSSQSELRLQAQVVSAAKRPLRESQHPALLARLRLSTTMPSGIGPSSFDPFLPTAAELARVVGVVVRSSLVGVVVVVTSGHANQERESHVAPGCARFFFCRFGFVFVASVGTGRYRYRFGTVRYRTGRAYLSGEMCVSLPARRQQVLMLAE